MSHKAVRQLIEEVSQSLADNIVFVYARETDFNSITNKKDPLVRLELLKSNPYFIEEKMTLNAYYPIEMMFYQLDDMQGAEEETLKVLDDCDKLVQEFLRKLNRLDFNEDTTVSISTYTVTISNIQCQPFIKQTVDCLTGFVVSFTMEVPDDFDYCSIY